MESAVGVQTPVSGRVHVRSSEATSGRSVARSAGSVHVLDAGILRLAPQANACRPLRGL